MPKLIGLTGLLLGVLTLAVGAAGSLGAYFTPSMLKGRQVLWVAPPQRLWLPQAQIQTMAIPSDLPTPPMTLELVWRLSGYQHAVTSWQLLTAYASVTSYVWRSIRSRDPQMDALLPLGQFNQAVIEFLADGQVRFSLNGRVIWQRPMGANIAGPLNGSWLLLTLCACQTPAAFVWKRIALYAP